MYSYHFILRYRCSPCIWVWHPFPRNLVKTKNLRSFSHSLSLSDSLTVYSYQWRNPKQNQILWKLNSSESLSAFNPPLAATSLINKKFLCFPLDLGIWRSHNRGPQSLSLLKLYHLLSLTLSSIPHKLFYLCPNSHDHKINWGPLTPKLIKHP